MTHRHRNRTTRTKRIIRKLPAVKPLAPIQVEVILPCPPTATPVVTWQAKGRRILHLDQGLHRRMSVSQ